MNIEALKRTLVRLSIFALMSILWVAGCAPQGAMIARPLVPTPIDAVPALLSPLPTPVQANDAVSRFNGLWVTPLPSEKAQLGAMTELVFTPPALATPNAMRYTAQTLIKGAGANQISVVVINDTQSKQEIARLGDDTSQSMLDTMNDEYVIWWCGACTSRKTGLYAYRMATSEQVFISENAGQYPKIDSEWVVYINDILPSGAELRAHNLLSGEDLLITQNMATRRESYQGPSSWGDFFAVRDGQIVWAVDQSAEKGISLYWGLQVYDLAQRKTRTLHLTESLGNFSQLGIFGDTVLWLRDFWQGYDLSQDAYFSIPIIPTGWERIRIEKISSVVASRRWLYWSLTVSGRAHYFAAPIIPKP
jgi:hypothetical protein